jgi:hypothetical protein
MVRTAMRADDHRMTINAALRNPPTTRDPASEPRRATTSLADIIESYIRDELLARETGLWL